MSNGLPAQDDTPPAVPRDLRAVIVVVSGFIVLVIIFVIGAGELPGDHPANVINTKGENVVAIASAAITAVATLVSAYFGVRAANLGREGAEAAGKRVAEYAAAVPQEKADEISRRLRSRGL